MPTADTIFLIDGSSQMYRAYHAIRELHGPDGQPTNAVYGFVTMLRKLIADHQPALIAAAFDVKGPTFRSEIASDYKANRPKTPDDLITQIAWIHDACEALGVPVLTQAGFEADDIIGTLAKGAREHGYKVAIVTSDKDFFQLVDDWVQVFNPRDPGTWYDSEGVKDKFGVAPTQVVDVLALMGDAVDNVKGVPGIGEKGARELINEYGSLDALLNNTSRISQKRYRTAMEKYADDAHRSRELVQIRTDVPVPFDQGSFRYQGPTVERCFTLFSELGFRRLLADYAPSAVTVEKDYGVVRSETELTTLISNIRSSHPIGLAVLPTNSDPMQADPVGISISLGTRHARYVPLGHRALDVDNNLSRSRSLEILGKPLGDSKVAKVGHDIKKLSLVLGRQDIELKGVATDTLIASYLLDPAGSHEISALAIEHLGYKSISTEQIIGKGSKALSFADVPADALCEFACESSDLPLQLADRLHTLLAKNELDALFSNLELPLLPVLVDLEKTGVQIDTSVLASQSHLVQEKLDQYQKDIYLLAGEEFNINSPKQLSVILFEKLQLPSLKKTGKTKSASTSVSVLQELALTHELPARVLEWRSLQKLKGTYIDALPELVNPETGRIHTSFNQAVTATGRLSSSEPNLQNIPIRTEIGREIRAAFTAPSGMVIISADYSQIELRVLAHLSEDKNLIRAFEQNEDIHDQTSRKVFGVDSGLDKHELRRRAKIINYALLYGKTAFSLSKDIGVTPHEAQTFIDAYFQGFPSVQSFIEATLQIGREKGIVKTMFGRRRRLPELTSHNGHLRSRAEREAVNMPVQGTAADILKRAMIDLHAALPSDTRMILTVHDELVLETPSSQAVEVSELVRDKMENAVQLKVPLTVDVGVGQNWKEAKG